MRNNNWIDRTPSARNSARADANVKLYAASARSIYADERSKIEANKAFESIAEYLITAIVSIVIYSIAGIIKLIISLVMRIK